MSSNKYIKIQYSLNNVKKTKSIKLNEEENLETNFKNNKNILNTTLNANTFHLIRDNQKILLNKKVKVKNLNIKEGDLIIASLKAKNNEIENLHNSNNISSANLNEETSQDSNIIEPINPRKKRIILIAIISFVLLALTFSLIYYLIFHPKDSKSYNNKNIDNDISTNQTEPIEQTIQIDPTNQIELTIQINQTDEKENVIINTTDIQEQDILSQEQKEKEKEKELIFQKEDFITKKTYPLNRLFLFNGEQLTEMKVEGENIKEENSYHNFSETCDFIFITRDSFLEKNDSTLIEKTWYSGYIAIYNLIIPNSTHDNHIIYDQKINEYLRINKRRLSSRDIFYINNGSDFCFAKIEFYHNGEIKNIYLPEGFLLEHYSYIKENIKLLITKISQNLYVDSIEKKLNEIIETEENDNDKDLYKNNMTDVNVNYEEEQNENYLRNLNIDKKGEKYNNIIYIKRRHSDNNYNNNSNNSEISYSFEDFLTQPLSKSIYYEFREANIINDTSYDINTDFISDDFKETDIYTDIYTDMNKLNINKNYSNLTEFSMKSIENDELKMEGGVVNTTIYSIIDEEGYLESVFEKSTLMMKSPEEDNKDDDKLDEETEALYNRIYNNDNQITLEHAKEKQSESLQKNNISFGLTYIYSNSSNVINCTAHFINGEINKKLYDYFDSFTYELYNDTINKTDISNNLHSYQSEDLNNNNTRYLSEEEKAVEYYGMKIITYVKQLYKYNLIGMKMEGQIYSEINPSTGKMSVYSIINFGNKNSKIKINDQKSNIHITLERSNQMGYNLILLLEQTNYELIQRNKNYSEIIIEFETNFTKFFEKYYDYSNLFRKSLNDLYNQVQNFSGNFFYELIDLINRVYYNYSLILEEVKNDEYDFINRIRQVTKEEYINYIYDMIDILENFENMTLTFLDDIDNELDSIEDFQIDVLYDIKDQIDESKLLFKKFNRNLFNSIEKGILTFKCDINDHIDNIIGELLYITDFLAININKNEILIRAIDENTRKDLTIKLKDFRNIILTIMDLLIKNINDDYEKEMNIEDNKSIKYISNNKALNFLDNIEKKSEKVINKIKAGIDNINIYESYSKNNDIINDINNKTFIEYINDIYTNIIYKALNITPEYLNENSNINKNKKILFEISKNITNIINQEIKEINEYVFSFSNQYIEQNIYNIHYNLYYSRKLFFDDEMRDLLHEFYLLLNRTIEIHLKQMIDYNFGLANQVFEEENNYFNIYRHKSRRFLTSDFIERYYQYKSKFEQYLLLTFSEEFLNLLEKYFY